MQPSITAFFKAKQPAGDKVTEATSEAPKEVQDKTETENESRSSCNTEIVESDNNKRESQTLKRAVDSDSDDEDDIRPARSKARPTLSSAENTPVKTQPAKEKADEVKSPAPSAKQFFSQSPLVSVEALIKKKMSSGSSALHENIGVSWFKALQPEFDKPYFKKLSDFVQQQRKAKTVYPPADKVFTWTHYHTIRDTRVVIIGQDPYHGPNQAHGLSFSVQKGVAIPKSLQNIYKELATDILDFNRPTHGDLTGWAKQGVLMLNACLTVNAHEANSHQGKGWETLTDAVISWISKNCNHKVVFILWGRFAQRKSGLIDKRHKILTSAHPSPLSADNGFFGCRHFSQTNEFLKSQKLPQIDWTAL